MTVGVMLRFVQHKGGIATYAKSLLEAVFRIDTSNRYVLLYQSRDGLGSFAGRPNVREAVVPLPGRLVWDQLGVAWAARRFGLDVIFNPKLSVPLFSGSRTVFVLHGGSQFALPDHYPWHDRLYTRLVMPLYGRKADAIISPTRTGAAEIVRYLHVRPDKVVQIYEAPHARFGPVPPEQREAVRARYGLPERFVLFVGTVAPLKNFGRVLRAYARFRERFPHLLVAPGFLRRPEDSVDRASPASGLALVRDLGLEDAVRLLGFVPDDDLPAFYAAADMLVFPSLYEGFGLPALEAMASGCPVIASTRGCSPEVVGDAALLADPYDVDDILRQMVRLASDEPLRRALVERGRRRAAAFSWEAAARQTLALFERLAAGSGRQTPRRPRAAA